MDSIVVAEVVACSSPAPFLSLSSPLANGMAWLLGFEVNGKKKC